MELRSKTTVILVSERYLVIRPRLWARLIVAVLAWTVLTLALAPVFLGWGLILVGIFISAILFVVYILGCVRIPYTVCVDRRKGVIKVPWLYRGEMLFPLVVKTYSVADVKVEKTLYKSGDAGLPYWQVWIVFPRGRRVVVFRSLNDGLSRTVEETLRSFTQSGIVPG
jgi:hypothetical protein